MENRPLSAAGPNGTSRCADSHEVEADATFGLQGGTLVTFGPDLWPFGPCLACTGFRK